MERWQYTMREGGRERWLEGRTTGSFGVASAKRPVVHNHTSRFVTKCIL